MLVTLSLGVLVRSVQGVGLTVGLPLPNAIIKSILRLAFGTAVKARLTRFGIAPVPDPGSPANLRSWIFPAPGFAGYMRMISRVLSVLLTISPEPASLFSAHWFSPVSFVSRCYAEEMLDSL